MTRRLFAAIFALTACLLSGVGAAQDVGTPSGMEVNPWKILIKDFGDDRLLYLYGTPGHITEQSFADMVTRENPYGVHIGRHLYPNADPAFDLTQGDCAGLTESDLDDILLNANGTVDWYQKKGFKKNGHYFNIVPDFRPSGSPKSDWVNLIVCKDIPGEAYILNKHRPDQSNFMGLKNRYAALLKHPIHKMVVPHELMHVYQMNFMPHSKKGKQEGQAIKTVHEGMADGAGLMSVFDRYGRGGDLEAKQKSYLSKSTIKGYSDPLSRRMFMIRAYNVPLQINEGKSKSKRLNPKWSNAKGRALVEAVDAALQERMSYYTSGFFYHLLERYLRRPGDITQLYSRFKAPADTYNIYPELDRFLKTKSKVKTEGPVLGMVLTQFLSEYAEWWDVRTAGKVLREEWLKQSFDGCPLISLKEGTITAHKETDISQFAGGCFDITIDAKLASRFPELELLVSSEDGDPDRIYMGLARTEHAGSKSYSCYDDVEGQSAPGTFPCLVNPVQGTTSSQIKSLAGKKIRAFSLPPFQGPVNRGSVMVRVILTDVPDKLFGFGVNGERADAATYRLTASIDSATVKGDGVPGSTTATTSNPAAQRAIGRQLREARPPRFTRADGPLTPTGTKTFASVQMRDVMNQGVNLSSAGLGQLQDGIAQTFYQIETSTDSQDGPELSFRTEDDLFGTGKLGRFPIQAMYGFDDEIGQQDQGKPSEINITVNSEEAMAYTAILHVCTYNPDAMLAKLMRNETFDPCEDGTPRSYEIENTIAFPALLPGQVSQVGAFAADETSQALRDYQNVRLARLGMPEAMNVSGYNDGSASSGSVDESDGAPTSTNGGELLLCSVRKPDQSCDCSCAAKDCLDRKRLEGEASSSDLSCRLTCGKRWKSCSASTP